jgi:hypothetical protein
MKKRNLVLVAIVLVAAATAWGQAAQYTTVPVRGMYAQSSEGEIFSYSGDAHFFWVPSTSGSGAGIWSVTGELMADGYSIMGTAQRVTFHCFFQDTVEARPGESVELAPRFWAVDSRDQKVWFQGSIPMELTAPR